MSAVIKNIYQRLSQVMAEIECVQKGPAKVNGQYTFVSHDSVAKAVHMPMVRAGIMMVPDILELIQDGNRTIVKMGISFVNVDQPEDRVVVNYTGYGIDSQDKGIGKAVSYAVKYALLKVFCLETGDDVEKDNIDHIPKKEVPEVEVPEPVINKIQLETVFRLLDRDEDRKKKLLKFLNIFSLDQIPASQFDRVVAGLTQSKVTKLQEQAS